MANKVKVLLLSASPKNLSGINSEEEFRVIQEVLPNEKFAVDYPGNVRVSNLHKVFFESQPQIVHFSGHGDPEGLVLEDDSGKPQVVPRKHLADLFKEFNNIIQVVCLSACFSEEQATAIYEHIDCVVGMKDEFTGSAAVKFARGFYRALGHGEPYTRAFRFGVNAIGLDGIEETKIPQPKIRRDSTVFTSAFVTSTLASSEETMNSASPSNSNPASQSMNISGGNISGQVAQAGRDVTQTQYQNQDSSQKQLTTVEVIQIIGQIEALLKNSTLPDEQRNKAIIHLEAVKEEAEAEEPDKEYAAKSLQKATKVLKDTNETIDAGKNLWSSVEPILKNLLPWLGVASHLLGI